MGKAYSIKQKEDLRLDHLKTDFMVSVTKPVVLKCYYSSESTGSTLKHKSLGSLPEFGVMQG